MDLATGVNTLVAPTTAGCADMTYAPTRNMILCVVNMTMWEVDPITASSIVIGNTHTGSEFNGGRFLAIASMPGENKPIEQQEVFQNEIFNFLAARFAVGLHHPATLQGRFKGTDRMVNRTKRADKAAKNPSQ